jgi:hypothetical protein
MASEGCGAFQQAREAASDQPIRGHHRRLAELLQPLRSRCWLGALQAGSGQLTLVDLVGYGRWVECPSAVIHQGRRSTRSGLTPIEKAGA